MEDKRPLETLFPKDTEVNPSIEIQFHKAKTGFKFNFTLKSDSLDVI